jgi:hypothetical protein
MIFVGPCIVIYFYSETKNMHNISNLFYFGATFFVCQTVSPSIIRSLRLFRRSLRPSSGVSDCTYNIIPYRFCGCLLATCMTYTWCCMYSLRLPMMDEETVWHMWSVAQNKINLRYCGCGWFFLALRPNAGHGLLMLEVSRSQTTTHHIR